MLAYKYTHFTFGAWNGKTIFSKADPILNIVSITLPISHSIMYVLYWNENGHVLEIT